MATVQESDLGDDYWATSEDVRDEFQLEIGNREPDLESRIQKATRRVQAWYSDATGDDIPDDLPDDIPALLRDATALMAASLAHQAFANNISGDNQDDQRHVFLEDAARDTFEDWMVVANVDPGAEDVGEASSNVTGKSGVIGGADRSPIDRGGY